MLERPSILAVIDEYFGVHPAVTLSGPRQCGKTTLARAFAARTADATFFDLEDAADRQKLVEPEQTLKPLTGLVVIDEIQRQPALFETLRVLLDRPAEPARFLLLGSASPHIIRGVSESLAGRAGGKDGIPAKYENGRLTEPALYQLSEDIGETKDVAAAHPDIVRQLLAFAETCRADLGDSLTQRTGAGAREPGRIAEAGKGQGKKK